MENKLLTLRSKIEQLEKQNDSNKALLSDSKDASNWIKTLKYSAFLDQEINESMFDGENAIFKGATKTKVGDNENMHLIGTWIIGVLNNEIKFRLWKVNKDGYYSGGLTINTLHDLAELSKDNTLTLKQ